MKKLILLLLLILCCVITCSCSGEDEGGEYNGEVITLNVYNWGEYISDGFEGAIDSNAEFEKYCREVLGLNVKVNYTTYATNEDMYSKIKSGAGSYDIVIPSDYMIQKMIAEDMLLEFDVAAEIENYQYIDPDFKNRYYDPDNRYTVAYTYGMTGIIYNTTMVDEEDLGTWGLLWNCKYAGKILQFNNPRDAFASAMYWKNIDINSTDTADWDLALSYLVQQKSLVQGYVNDEIFNKMTSGSAAIAPYFVGDFITMLDQNEHLDFYYPTEGVNVFVDAMCIPKGARQPELAKEYINFMLSEEIAVANALYIGYASPNVLVRENAEYKEEMGEELIDLLYDQFETLETTYDYDPSYHSFTPEIQSYVNTLWETLKTENSTELWVHITAAAIVVGVLTPLIYSVYDKKRRSKDYRERDKRLRIARKAQNK